jgi:hypothetical protein
VNSRIVVFSTLLLIAIVVSAPPARCQIAERELPKNEFGVWAGWSPDSPHVIGTTSHRQIILLAGHYGRTLFSTNSFSLQYTIDAAPLEMVLEPKITQVVTPGGIFFQPGHREYVYGAGVNPLGFKLNFLRQHRWQPFIASTAGFVASTHVVPTDVPQGTKFNFTFDFQGGIQRFNRARDRAWILGYKLDHISNANRVSLNPGMDGNVIFIGYSFFR